MNVCMFTGRLTHDPEVREVNGTNVVNFSIAVNDGYKDKETGEWQDRAVFPKVQLWGSRANFVGTLKVGALIQVVGKYSVRSWEDKEGNKRYDHSFRAEQFECLSRGPNDDKNGKAVEEKDVAEENPKPKRKGRPTAKATPKVVEPESAVEEDNTWEDNTPF